MWINR